MGDMKWTGDQQKVIDLRNRNILVSAAAGSGKTAVLVERIVQEVTQGEHPIDIDRLLVVTFTKAAASEMRQRVGRALEERLIEYPGDKRLQRQLSLLHNAQITTIDSFCQNIIRNYFHVIDLDPVFRVADDTEIKIMKQEVLEQILEECYENAALEPENPGRGWYGIYTFMVEQSIDPGELRWSLRQGESLALVLLDIHAYRSKLLDEDALGNIRNILSFFMQYKKDVILRPVYDREGNGRSCEPDAFKLVLEHMRQIGEILKSVKHSVFIFQGMLVGSWGEMHDSEYLSPEHLHKMWSCMREYLGEDICLAVRTPSQWRTLKSEEDFLQKKYSRLSLFDDGILGSLTHLGTFGTMTKEAAGWRGAWTRKEELDFISRLTESLPCGGEVTSCTGEDAAKVKEADFIISELKNMHLVYLDSTYDMEVLNRWKQINYTGSGIWQGQSLYEYIGSHLGYRLTVKSVQMKRTWRGKAEFTIEIENTGFGKLFQDAELFLMIENEDQQKEVSVSMDLRKILPGTVLCGKAVTEPAHGKVFLKVRRRSDGRIIRFVNRGSADSLYIGCLHK